MRIRGRDIMKKRNQLTGAFVGALLAISGASAFGQSITFAAAHLDQKREYLLRFGFLRRHVCQLAT